MSKCDECGRLNMDVLCDFCFIDMMEFEEEESKEQGRLLLSEKDARFIGLQLNSQV